MALDNYLVKEVKSGEFDELKTQEKDLVAYVFGSFNDVWKLKVQGVKTTFKYNSQTRAIGIYIERTGREQQVIERRGLSEEENVVALSVYSELERRLSKLRLHGKK